MLTDEQIEALAEEHGSDIDGLVRAVEAEVHKQDTALIQRLLDALVHPGGDPTALQERVAVVKDARERLKS